MEEVGGGAAAVACLFLAFCVAVMALRGTYYDVWRTLATPIDTSVQHAPAGGGGGSKGPN